MNWTISRTAQKFGLSRSTLIYYDSIGLLCPARKRGTHYRLYSESDLSRLEEICRLRGTGVSLEEIKQVLHCGRFQRNNALQNRLRQINEEIGQLRQQQRIILGLLADRELDEAHGLLTKEKWILYLRNAGLDESGMQRWHREFELSSPEAHRDFLYSLGLPEEEVRQIREYSRLLQPTRIPPTCG